MKQYQYNYSYLGRWMEANPRITNREILQAFGSVNNNNSLALYEQRKTPMPLINLLRFCNTFGVPISAFIVETDIGGDKEESDKEESDNTQKQVVLSIDDQLEPDGGYIAVGERRPHGSRALRDPLEVEHHPSVVPGLSVVKTNKEEIQAANIQQSATTTHASIHQSATTNVSPSPNKEAEVSISTLNKMLDIIAEQQKQIASLTQQVGELSSQIVRLSSERMKSESMKSESDINAYMVAKDKPHHRP